MPKVRVGVVLLVTLAVGVSPVVAVAEMPGTEPVTTDAANNTAPTGSVHATSVDVDPDNLPGNGTDADPYIITNASELQAMEDDLNASYRLGSDINASETTTWNGGKGFDPIGAAAFNDSTPLPFNGSFDGDGHTIRSLTITRPAERYVGVFGLTQSDVEIKDVAVTNVTVTGSWTVGGLVGDNEGTVREASASGSVNGSDWVGGLVGFNRDNGTVRNVSAGGSVNGSVLVGGLVGFNRGTVRNATASAAITGSGFVGGLIGHSGGSIRNSHYNVSEVTINGEKKITIGALFDKQFQDWKSDRDLNLSDYGSFNKTADGVEISTVQGIKDALGFTQNPALSWTLNDDINVSREDIDLYIPYLAGDLDGNGHTMIVDIDNPTASAVGAIGYNDGGEIANLSVTGEITGGSQVGGLVGDNKGTVRETSASVRVNGSNVGGLVGVNIGTVKNASAGGPVNGSVFVGGLIGSSRGTVTNASANGSVNGSDWVGGLIGRNSGTVREASAGGPVNGSDRVGGLVGWNDGTVRNASANGPVDGSVSVGGLIGFSRGTLKNASANGSVNGSDRVGVLVGQNAGTVRVASASGSVNGSTLVGGLIGFNYGTVNEASVSGPVTGSHVVGGLVGLNRANITETSASGPVKGSNVGGLVGVNIGTVKNASSGGPVNGSDRVGGLVGTNDGTVRNAWASGRVIGSSGVGGLVGVNFNGSVEQSYWDVNTTGQATSAGNATGLTTAQMTGEAARTNMTGLEFGTVWQTRPDDYPVLIALSDETKSTTCIADAVSGGDDTISLSEIQTAINWWARGEPVPDTGGETISLSKIQSLIDAWAKGSTVSCAS